MEKQRPRDLGVGGNKCGGVGEGGGGLRHCEKGGRQPISSAQLRTLDFIILTQGTRRRSLGHTLKKEVQRENGSLRTCWRKI